MHPLARTGLLLGLLGLLGATGACEQRRPETISDDLLARGRAAFARGEQDRAVALMRQAVARTPTREAPRLALAEALRRTGQPKAAESVLREGLDRAPDRLGLLLALADALAAQGRFDDAVTALDRARRVAPREAEPGIRLGELYERHGQGPVARSHFLAALALAHRDADRLAAGLGLARLAEAAGSPAEAIVQLRQAVALAPSRADLAERLGRALLATGRPAEAEPVLRQAVAQGGGTPEAHLALGLAQRDLGQVPAALASLAQADRLRPRDVRVLLPLAQLLLAAGRTDEAYATGVRALAVAPGHAEIAWLMVPLYLRRQLPGPALDLLRELEPVRAHDPDLWVWFGETYEALGKPRQAQESYAKAVTLRPRDRALLRRQAFAARRAGDYASATRGLEPLVEADPADVEAVVHLAICREHLGARGQAETLLRQATGRHPERPEPWLYLGWIALRAGQPGRAVDLAARADRLAAGQSLHALDVLASALARLGRGAEALAALDRALALPVGPDDREYLQSLRTRLVPAPPRPR
jgi:tetratricopeptide (TPR) repeat protein